MKTFLFVTVAGLTSLGATPAKRPPSDAALTPLARRIPLVRVAPRSRTVKPRARHAVPRCRGLEVLSARDGAPPFRIGEELAYELSVAGAYVGRFETKVGRPRTVAGRRVIPLFGRARTNAFISSFQAFSGRYMSMVDPSTLRPLGLRVESTYGEDPRWEKVRFSENLRSASVDFLMKGHQRHRDWTASHRLTDLLTMLYAARQVRIAPGLEACQDVFGARRLWQMDAKVVRTERIDTPAGEKEAYLVETTFHRKPHRTLNNRKRPKAEVDVYFAKDRAQTPLRFVVRMNGVRAEGKLTRWSLDGASEEDAWSF